MLSLAKLLYTWVTESLLWCPSQSDCMDHSWLHAEVKWSVKSFHPLELGWPWSNGRTWQRHMVSFLPKVLVKMIYMNLRSDRSLNRTENGQVDPSTCRNWTDKVVTSQTCEERCMGLENLNLNPLSHTNFWNNSDDWRSKQTMELHWTRRWHGWIPDSLAEERPF